MSDPGMGFEAANGHVSADLAFVRTHDVHVAWFTYKAGERLK